MGSVGADFVVLPQCEGAEVRALPALSCEPAGQEEDPLLVPPPPPPLPGLSPWQAERARAMAAALRERAAPALSPGELAACQCMAARSAFWSDVRARLEAPRALPARRPMTSRQRRAAARRPRLA
jgi:hypothetical protein